MLSAKASLGPGRRILPLEPQPPLRPVQLLRSPAATSPDSDDNCQPVMLDENDIEKIIPAITSEPEKQTPRQRNGGEKPKKLHIYLHTSTVIENNMFIINHITID